MPRIAGVDVPADKTTWCALTYIHGIGKSSALEICKEARIDPNGRMKDLSEDEIGRMAAVIDRSFVVEGALRRQVMQNIARLRDIQCYRGQRHRRGLPARGQRTRTNARTRKGPRKTVAGKKGVKDLR
jgi:small subunit ribosomal protein S13